MCTQRRITYREKGMHMKKTVTRGSMWDWLFGSGWAGGGANG
jgi:hypothetical protein